MLTEKEVLTGAMIYIMLQSIDPNEPAGKRSRKGISRAIKKRLAIHAKEANDRERHLELIHKSEKLIYEARDKLSRDEDIKVDPGSIISTLINRWPDAIAVFGLNPEHVKSLKEAYSDSRLQYVSVQYANRMKEVVNEFLEKENRDGKDVYSGRISIHPNKRKLNIK